MAEYPEYEENGQEIPAFSNIWRDIQPHEILGAECFNPEAQLSTIENLIVLKMTSIEFTEMFSALYNGAEMTYPDRFMQIIINFLAGLHCPPVLEEQECFEYPTYASFMRYLPVNPYLQPNEIPDGYLTQPFIVNGENGNDLPEYEHFDVIVPFGSITFDIDWWTTIAGQLPTIEVMVQGAGKVFLKMLAFPQGGLAVITVDNPPNLIDIIGGVVTSADNIVDLNQDLVSLPPETAKELIYELDVVGTGIHTIYIVFLPILDDSLIPLRFGGGFRGVTLCDFIEEPEMGITNIRFEDCNLEVLEDGVWNVVNGWENWLDCVPSGGGGGGVAAFFAKSFDVRLPTATVTTTSTTFVNVVGYPHTPTHENLLVIVKNVTALHSTASGHVGIALYFAAAAGVDGSEAAVQGTTGRQVGTSARWNGVTPNVEYNINIMFRSQEAGTSTVSDATDFVFTVLEWDNPEDIFVQDVDYLDGTIRKKIGGVWFDVLDLEGLLSPIQATATNALAVAAAAAAAAAAAQTTANGAVTVNNTQNNRLDGIDDDIEDLELSISQINITIADHETRIDALEAAIGEEDLGGVWSHEFNWGNTDPENVDWGVLDGTWIDTSPGIVSTPDNPSIITLNTPAFHNNQVTHIGIEIRHAGDNFLSIAATINGITTGDGEHTATSPANRVWTLWMRVPNITANGINLALVGADGTQYYCTKVLMLGRGSDPF